MCLLILLAKAQNIDSALLSNMKLNFVVPDMPAFKALGTEPSNILRPSTPHALAVSVSSFSNNGKAVIPKAFAMEISPALLLNANKAPTELKKYAANKIINSLRISLGSSTDSLLSPSGRNLALGVRISLISKGDFATDMDELKRIAEKLQKFRHETSDCRKKFAQANIDSVKSWLGDDNIAHDKIDSLVDWEYELDIRLKKKDSVWQKKFINFQKYFCPTLTNDPNPVNDSTQSFENWLKKEKDQYKKDHWNDDKLDVAFSYLSSSPDSLVKNILFNNAQLWATYAKKAGKHGQLLIGINAQISKNLTDTVKANANKSYFNFYLPVRYLVGTNRVKGFAELQYGYTGKLDENKLLFNLGAELNIMDGIWLNVYAGYEKNYKNSSSTITTNLNFKLTLPEKFSLF